jgi:hypothetical protein
MEHTSIKRAFKHAQDTLDTKCMLDAKDTQNSDSLIIYMVFQRLTLCYKDIYYILTGNKAQVAKAIENAMKKPNKTKKKIGIRMK